MSGRAGNRPSVGSARSRRGRFFTAATCLWLSLLILHLIAPLIAPLAGDQPIRVAAVTAPAPPLGAWTPAASPTSCAPNPACVPRTNHTATLLPSGKVLVAGGEVRNSSGELEKTKTSLLYDPVIDTWVPTGDMTVPRTTVHDATLLLNGKVLVVGDNESKCPLVPDNRPDPNNPFPCTEPAPGYLAGDVYDPAGNGTWSPTGPMVASRLGGQTTTLLNSDPPASCGVSCGKALVTGGDLRFGDPQKGMAELYDPNTNQWTATGTPVLDRGDHVAVRLISGQVLIAGGISVKPYDRSRPGRATELYNPLTGSWAPSGPLNENHSTGHRVTLLNSGQVLYSGGGELEGPTDNAEIYEPSPGVWSLLNETMSVPRYRHTSTLLPGGEVLLSGGLENHTPGGIHASSELYSPEEGSFRTSGEMAEPRSGHTATMIDSEPLKCGRNCGKVLVLGGNLNGTAELYSPGLTVSSIQPAEGPTTGGTEVKITGSGFTGDSSVHFGDAAALSSNYMSGTEMRAVSPPHVTPEAFHVTVTNLAGTSQQTPSDLFTYMAVGSGIIPSVPIIAGLVPPSGPVSGGTDVRIQGQRFTGASRIAFGDAKLTGTDFSVISDAEISLATPAGQRAGPVSVTVTTSTGTSNPGQFVYVEEFATTQTVLEQDTGGIAAPSSLSAGNKTLLAAPPGGGGISSPNLAPISTASPASVPSSVPAPGQVVSAMPVADTSVNLTTVGSFGSSPGAAATAGIDDAPRAASRHALVSGKSRGIPDCALVIAVPAVMMMGCFSVARRRALFEVRGDQRAAFQAAY